MLFLVGFSFSVSEFRMGSVILLIHDMSNPIYEASNVARYIGWNEASNMLYTIYALVYLVTRMIAFPIRVILAIPMHFPASVYYAFTTCGHPTVDGGCLSEPLFTINFYYIWICLLGLLYLTHLHWSVFIAKTTKISLYTAPNSPKDTPSAATDDKPRHRKLNNSQRAQPWQQR
jgi:ceramide synthetase